MICFNASGLKYNAQHAAGIILGKLILKPLGLRFGKEQRGRFSLFSTVSANLAADGIEQDWFVFVVFYRKSA